MQAALVPAPGAAPVLGQMAEPVPSAEIRLVHVSAAAMSQLARSRASGRHYSAGSTFPIGVGVDGVGRLENGERVYFVLPAAPYGSMSARTLVPAARCLPLPEGLDDITAAAIAIPGLSSWAALTERAQFRPGETVLVNGATGASGRLAVQIARHLGAGKVIATGRNPQALAALPALGADVVLPLGGATEGQEDAFQAQFAQGVDVVLDYLWGESAEQLLIAAAKAGPDGRAIRFVQIGAMSGADIRLPSAVLRSSALTLMGSGIGSVPMARMARAVAGVLEAAVPARLEIAAAAVPLAQFERVWSAPGESGPRVVFTPDPSL